MDVYYYCSYTGSPVGFKPGKISMEPEEISGCEDSVCSLWQEDIPDLIRKWFEDGRIRKCIGYVIKDLGYFLLVKNLTAEGRESTDPSRYFLNFAIVTPDKEEFDRMFQGEKASDSVSDPEEITAALRDTISISPDSSGEFGFTVSRDRLNALLKRPLYTLIEPEKRKELKKRMKERPGENNYAEDPQKQEVYFEPTFSIMQSNDNTKGSLRLLIRDSLKRMYETVTRKSSESSNDDCEWKKKILPPTTADCKWEPIPDLREWVGYKFVPPVYTNGDSREV